MELKGCPFCGRNEVAVNLQVDDKERHVCRRCGAIGPRTDSQYNWNSRFNTFMSDEMIAIAENSRELLAQAIEQVDDEEYADIVRGLPIGSGAGDYCFKAMLQFPQEVWCDPLMTVSMCVVWDEHGDQFRWSDINGKMLDLRQAEAKARTQTIEHTKVIEQREKAKEN